MAAEKTALKEAGAQKAWEIFRQINRIPRCSGQEQRIIEWLKGFAKSRNLACRCDAVGNTVFELPATKDYENSPAIVLQSHVDMVCEKTPESKHDFSNDPIEIIERDGWVTADGTTLGADNGLGVALALALADEKLPHPKLELLFTVDEETGLTGANGIEQGFISGKYLINLDGEDESLIVGCAGGEQTEITLKINRQDAPEGLDSYILKVSGLSGGHSGADIDKNRANAIKLLAKTLGTLQSKFGLCTHSINGGKAANAIPRDAQAIICLAPSVINAAKKTLIEIESSFKKEFASTDPNLKVELKKATEFLATEVTEDTENKKKKIINRKSQIINLLWAIPTGVYRMSDEFTNTVETSNNLASVETITNENLIRITTMQRSFEMSRMDELTGKITEIAKQTGAKVKTHSRYPAWKPDTNSCLFRLAKDVYKKIHRKEPLIKAVHAGLEPAVIGEKFPGIEMISAGPTIENLHSPAERLNIASVDNIWRFLVELIPSIK